MGLCSLLVSLFGLRQPSPVVYRLYGRANTIGIPPRGIKPTDTSQDPCCQCPYPRGRPLPTHTSLRPSDTQRQVWLGLLGGHYSFPRGPGVWLSGPGGRMFPLCPQIVSVSLSPVEVLWSNSAVLQRDSQPLHQIPRLGNLMCGQNFSAVQELLWYSCSLAGMGINFNVIAPLLSSLCRFSFVPGHWVSLFGLFQHPPVDSCSKVVAVWVFSRKMSAHPTQPSCSSHYRGVYLASLSRFYYLASYSHQKLQI